MTAPQMPFNEEDASTWTHENVKQFVESSKHKPKSFYLNFFGWSEEEYKEAKDHTVAELLKHFDPSQKFPIGGHKAKLRYTAQATLVRDWPDLFVNRHGPNTPAWFDVNLISRPPSNLEAYNTKNVIQQFISLTRNLSRNQLRSLKRSKHTAMDQDDDDDDDGYNNHVSHKRSQTSRIAENPPVPIATSMSMLSSPSAMLPGSQTSVYLKPSSSPHTAAQNFSASVDMDPRSTGSSFDWNRKAPTEVTAASDSRLRVKNPASLILYITRVTIEDQTLILERDRFGVVDNLFERGRLMEPYIQELIFGNPVDNKLTFIWFFDDTSDDKLKMIKNRPCAEAAIYKLKARAQRSKAAGIQLFDAADRDTAALVPVHEVNRKDDFVERVSFELEVDDGDEDKENDDEDDVEDSEKASKVDSAYRPRHGELQLENVAVKEESDREPNMTWEGHQRQEDNVGSGSDLEED